MYVQFPYDSNSTISTNEEATKLTSGLLLGCLSYLSLDLTSHGGESSSSGWSSLVGVGGDEGIFFFLGRTTFEVDWGALMISLTR